MASGSAHVVFACAGVAPLNHAFDGERLIWLEGNSVLALDLQTCSSSVLLSNAPVEYLAAGLAARSGDWLMLRERASERLFFFQLAAPFVSFVHAHGATERKPNALLGAHFAPGGHVVLVTVNGVDLFKLEPPALRFLRRVQVYPVWHHWEPAAGVALVATGERGTDMHALQFGEAGLLRRTRFTLPAEGLVRHGDVTLLPCCGAVAAALHPPDRGALHLFDLGLGGGEPGAPLLRAPLPVAGRLLVASVDDLLVAYSRETELAFVLDPRLSPDGPLAGPLPPALLAPPSDAPRAPDLAFYPPSFAVDRVDGSVWRVGVDIRSLATALPGDLGPARLTAFLLRRAHAGALLAASLRAAVAAQRPVPLLAPAFDAVNGALAAILRAAGVRSQPTAEAGGGVYRCLHAAGAGAGAAALAPPGHALVEEPSGRAGIALCTYTVPRAAGGALSGPHRLLPAAGAGELDGSAGADFVFEQPPAAARGPRCALDQPAMAARVLAASEGRHGAAVLLDYLRSLLQAGLEPHHFVADAILDALAAQGAWAQLASALAARLLPECPVGALRLLQLAGPQPRGPRAAVAHAALEMAHRCGARALVADLLAGLPRALPAAILYALTDRAALPPHAARLAAAEAAASPDVAWLLRGAAGREGAGGGGGDGGAGGSSRSLPPEPGRVEAAS